MLKLHQTRSATRKRPNPNPWGRLNREHLLPAPVNLPEAGQMLTFSRKYQRMWRLRQPLFVTIKAFRQEF